MILYIMRHGETALNVVGRLQGWIDEPLNENGRELARITGKALEKVPFDMVYSSPLKRAWETGNLVAAPSQEYYGRKIPVLADDRLKEIRFGSWEGLGCLASNYAIPDPDCFKKFYTDALHFEGSPDGESIAEVCKRTGEFLREIIDNPENEDKTILISTHGCAMRSMLQLFYEDKTDFWQGHVPYNCAVNIVEVKNGQGHFIGKDQIYYDKSLCIDNYKVVDQ